LAQQLGVFTEIAGDRGSYWRTMAPPPDAFYSIVNRHIQAALNYTDEAKNVTTSQVQHRVGRAKDSAFAGISVLHLYCL
jgi:hypothetical protein